MRDGRGGCAAPERLSAWAASPRRDSEGKEQSHRWNSKPFAASKCLWPAKKPGNIECLQMPQCKHTYAHVGSDKAQLLGGQEEMGAPQTAQPLQHGGVRTIGTGSPADCFPGGFSAQTFPFSWLFPRAMGFTSQATHGFCHLLLQAQHHAGLSHRGPRTRSKRSREPTHPRGRFSSYFLSK